MVKRFVGLALCSVSLVGCQLLNESQQSATGTLQVRANGEDFVRQGFTSKDDWVINFNHVYVHLAGITAYQTDPPFDPDSGDQMQVTTEVTVPAKTVDLAAGDENASPVVVAQADAPAGQYNALSWKMAKAPEGPAAGQAMLLKGQAQKQGQTLEFTLSIDREFSYTCGEFVGDERKGIVSAGEMAELEATFHLDHLFGDRDLPLDDELNADALGFEPFAALAKGQKVEADWSALKAQLPSGQLQILETALSGLGHVGEGHCRSEVTTS